MKRVWTKNRHAIYEYGDKHIVAKRDFFGRYKWNGWQWSEFSYALTSIGKEVESQKDYNHKLPKPKKMSEKNPIMEEIISELKKWFNFLLMFGVLGLLVFMLWYHNQPHTEQIKGHDYIKVYEYNGEEIWHDPDCRKCKKENE